MACDFLYWVTEAVLVAPQGASWAQQQQMLRSDLPHVSSRQIRQPLLQASPCLLHAYTVPMHDLVLC